MAKPDLEAELTAWSSDVARARWSYRTEPIACDQEPDDVADGEQA